VARKKHKAGGGQSKKKQRRTRLGPTRAKEGRPDGRKRVQENSTTRIPVSADVKKNKGTGIAGSSNQKNRERCQGVIRVNPLEVSDYPVPLD